MKTQVTFFMIGLLFFCACDMGDAGSSLLRSRTNTVHEHEATTVSYHAIGGRAYVHIQLPDTLEGVHTVAVCAYDEGAEACCSQWLLEGVDEFWLPYNQVENCIVRVTCWGRFGTSYLTASL